MRQTKMLVALLSLTGLYSLNSIGGCGGAGGDIFVNDKLRNPRNGGFVAYTANADETIKLNPSASICEYANVEDYAEIFGNALIKGYSAVRGNAHITGSSIITDHAVVEENAAIEGAVVISGKARIYGRARIQDLVKIGGDAQVGGNVVISGDLEINTGVFETNEAVEKFKADILKRKMQEDDRIRRENEDKENKKREREKAEADRIAKIEKENMKYRDLADKLTLSIINGSKSGIRQINLTGINENYRSDLKIAFGYEGLTKSWCLFYVKDFSGRTLKEINLRKNSSLGYNSYRNVLNLNSVAISFQLEDMSMRVVSDINTKNANMLYSDLSNLINYCESIVEGY